MMTELLERKPCYKRRKGGNFARKKLQTAYKEIPAHDSTEERIAKVINFSLKVNDYLKRKRTAFRTSGFLLYHGEDRIGNITYADVCRYTPEEYAKAVIRRWDKGIEDLAEKIYATI